MDDKLKKIMFIVMGGFVVLFIFLFLISSCDKKLTPKELETKIVDKAKNYFSVYEDELPGENSVLTLSLNDLVNKGIIKELDKLLDKDTDCSGNLIIENNNNYYMYSPTLNCSDGIENYNTINLYDLLLDNVVTSGNGLYNMGNSYYFRGDSVNNYLIFDGILWRIIGINSDKSIKLIEVGKRDSVVWDNRYNTDRSTNSGINSFVNNNINSRIKDYLENIYANETILNNDAKGYIKPTQLCVGKRTDNDTINDGSLECSETMDNQYLGLLQANEFLLASLDSNCVKTTSSECSNYNYLTSLEKDYWTITAKNDNNYQVYKINSSVLSTTNASNFAMARLVINISENTNITGSGTSEDPYIVFGYTNEIKKFN